MDIEGLKVIPKRQIVDERGKIMHMLKATDSEFIDFGEIYFSTAWPGVIKAWHVHTRMTVTNYVVSGYAKLVVCDLREDSPSFMVVKELFLGEDNRSVVQIPPGIANGYKAYGNVQCVLANCANIPHDPNEMLRIPFDTDQIPYDWQLRNG